MGQTVSPLIFVYGELYIRSMATYKISPDGNRGFHIAIVGDDGARQTLLGFKSQQAAEAWVLEDQRRTEPGDVQRSS